MKVCIQRVKSASVTVENEVIAKIGQGLLVLVGIGREDTMEQAKAMIKKIMGIRLWVDTKDPNRTWASNVKDNNYEVLLVSQFTMYGYLKGHKPDFHLAMPPSDAKAFYDNFVTLCKQAYHKDKVQSGIFGADMLVDIANDGPVTMVLESPPPPPEKQKKSDMTSDISTTTQSEALSELPNDSTSENSVQEISNK